MKAAFNKILSRKKKPKTLNTGPGLNQSMIDMIVNESHQHESFHSQRHVRSPTSPQADIFLQDLPRDRDLFDSPNLIKPKSNISSVLNVPKKRSIVEDLYEILQDHVITQLGDMITSKRAKDQKIDIPKVKLSDFQDYITNLKNVYTQYQKQNARRKRRNKEVQGTDSEASLQKCYQVVPSQYFDDDFLFNFEYFTSDKEKVFKTQDYLTEYLDSVELNLNLQISTKFQDFLDVILKLSQMEMQIQNSLYVTKFFKTLNTELKNKCSEEVKKVLKLRHKKANMQKVLEIVNVISAVRKTIPSLTELVEKNNLQGAITLIKTSEETYQNKLKGVKVVKRLNLDFKDARNMLEKLVTAKFEDKAITYLTKTLGYTKKSQMMHLPDISIVEESFMNVSTFDGSAIFDEEPGTGPGAISLNWSIEPFNPDKQLEGLLMSTVLEYIKIRAFPMYRYREKVGELLNKFHNRFMSDMQDYVSTITVPQPGPNQDNMLFDLHIKFLLFYFNIFKRFIQTQFTFSHQILIRLLKYYNQSFYDPESRNTHQGKEALSEEAYIAINDTVEDIYSTIALIFWNFNTKMTEIIRKQSVEYISIHQFAKLNVFFEEVAQFFKKDLNVQEKLTTWIVTDIEKLKISLLNNNENFDEKITIEPLLNLRIQCGKDYVSYFHKHNHDTIKHTLEQDTWMVSDIPYTYRIYFDLIFNGDNSHHKASISEKPELDDDDIFRSARPDVNDLDVVRRLALGETPKQKEFPGLPVNDYSEKTEKSIFEIKKSELIVNKQRFKLNGSLLVLIKLTCDYYNVAYKFESLRELTLTKMFDLLKFYNSFTKRLINNAEATMFGKVKKITAKILGLSIISLDLLLVAVTYLNQTIEKSMKNLKEGWLHAETENIKGEIKNHIYEIKLKICLILKNKLIEQCTDLRHLNWGHNQLKVNIPTKSSASILHNIRQMYKSIEDVLFREQLVDLFESIFSDLKNNYLPIFEGLNIENKLAAKRVKEELEYFKEDLHHLHIFQEPELKFDEFEDRIKNLVQNRCIPFLGTDTKATENEEASPNGKNLEAENPASPVNDEDPIAIEATQTNGENAENTENGETAQEEQPEAEEQAQVQEENTQVQEEAAPKELVQEEAVEDEEPAQEEAVQEGGEEVKEENIEEKAEEVAVEENKNEEETGEVEENKEEGGENLE